MGSPLPSWTSASARRPVKGESVQELLLDGLRRGYALLEHLSNLIVESQLVGTCHRESSGLKGLNCFSRSCGFHSEYDLVGLERSFSALVKSKGWGYAQTM